MPEGPQLMEEERVGTRSPDRRGLEQQEQQQGQGLPIDSRRHEQVPDNRYSQSKPREYRRVSLKWKKMVLLQMLTHFPTKFGSLILT